MSRKSTFYTRISKLFMEGKSRLLPRWIFKLNFLELKVIINLCQTLSLFAPHLSLIFASRSRKSSDKKPGEENLTRKLGNDKSGSPIHLVPSCLPFRRGQARNLRNGRRLQRLTWLAPFSKGIPWRRPEAQEQGSIGRKVQKVNNYKRDISYPNCSGE